MTNDFNGSNMSPNMPPYGSQYGWPNSTFNGSAPAYYGSPVPVPFRTNKVLVTSLEEAIAKQTERNSEMYYWDQSRPLIYVVRTDMEGRKSWAQLPYTLPNQDGNTPATKADILALEAKIAALESANGNGAVPKKKKVEEVVENVKSNG